MSWLRLRHGNILLSVCVASVLKLANHGRVCTVCTQHIRFFARKIQWNGTFSPYNIKPVHAPDSWIKPLACSGFFFFWRLFFFKCCVLVSLILSERIGRPKFVHRRQIFTIPVYDGQRKKICSETSTAAHTLCFVHTERMKKKIS